MVKITKHETVTGKRRRASLVAPAVLMSIYQLISSSRSMDGLAKIPCYKEIKYRCVYRSLGHAECGIQLLRLSSLGSSGEASHRSKGCWTLGAGRGGGLGFNALRTNLCEARNEQRWVRL